MSIKSIKFRHILSVIATIFIPLFIWFNPYNGEVTSLTFSLTNHVEKINLNETNDVEKLKIFYNDQQINNLSYTKYRIYNTGTVPIKPGDYIENLSIALPSSVKILSLKIEPNDLMQGIIEEGNKIVLDKNLINPGEFVDIEITSSGSFNPDKVDIKGRVIGVSNYKLSDKKILSVDEERMLAREEIKDVSSDFLFVIIFFVLFAALIYVMEKFKDNKTFSKAVETFGNTLFLIMITLFGITVLFIVYDTARLVWLGYLA